MEVQIRCLVVGMPLAVVQDRSGPLAEAQLTSFTDIGKHLPPPASLELVIAPLIARDFDALEVIATLAQHGYRGRVQIVAPNVPNKGLVLRELRDHAKRKGMSIELVDRI